MEPIFPKWANKIPLIISIAIPVTLIGIVGIIWYYFSPNFLAVGYQPNQPVLFSHKLHAGELGVDCRYCHSTVEKAEFAALPSTATCMGCHNKVKTQSPRIEPVKTSYENNTPIPWVGINALPRYAHFPHNSHVNIGVGCVSCHGRIDEMEVVYQAKPMSMGQCLDCHRNPEPHLIPPNEVTNMVYSNTVEKKTHQNTLSETDEQVLPSNHVSIQPPTYCSACHY